MSVALPLDLLHALQSRKNVDLSLVPKMLDASVAEQIQAPEVVSLGWPELMQALPDGGLPHGVVELSAPRALGGLTRVALAAIRGGQERGEGAWCAWVDPEGSLYAPGVARSEVDLRRLLVVRPPRKDLGRVAVKLVQARAFEVIVLDYAPPALVRAASSPQGRSSRPRGASPRAEVLVRKLALLAAEGGSTVILLTDADEPRPVPWPVALRLSLARVPGGLTVKVTKDRFCRLGSAKVAWSSSLPAVHGALS